jgi:hypothetical protein
MGKALYPNAKELMITADGGGSNGSRVQLWLLSCSDLPMSFLFQSVLAIFHPGQASGKKSSVGAD